MTQPLAFIIEDDAQLSSIYALTLRNDFDVEVITHGDIALQRLSEAEPRLILLDLHLPGVNGQDILAAIRCDERLKKSRVILTTADARWADMLADSADFVLLKPVSPVQLRDLANRIKPMLEQ